MNAHVNSRTKDLLLEVFQKAGELLQELGLEVGVNEEHARSLRFYAPAVPTPVGSLGARFRNVEVSKHTGKTIAYHQAEYLWQGQTIRAVVRCEVGSDGRPFVAHAFAHKSVK